MLQFPPIHETETVRKTVGPALRPGGLTLVERVLSLFSFPAGALLLDVGCGAGATAAHLRQCRNLITFGMDSAAKMLAEAGSLHHDVPLLRGCAQQLPCCREAFDGVICECVLSLIADKPAALLEFHRVLRPGGLLILSDIYSRGQAGKGDTDEFPISYRSNNTIVSRPVQSLLEEIGFGISLSEDHSHLLRELAARLVFECGSLATFWSEISGVLNCGDVRFISAGGRPGYYLLVARKEQVCGVE